MKDNLCGKGMASVIPNNTEVPIAAYYSRPPALDLGTRVIGQRLCSNHLPQKVSHFFFYRFSVTLMLAKTLKARIQRAGFRSATREAQGELLTMRDSDDIW
jgi:hypothetical protein